MIAALALACTAWTPPSTFDALELAKVKASLEIKSLEEDWTIDIVSPDSKVSMHKRVLISDDKQYFLVETDGEKTLESGNDGSTQWWIRYGDKTFYRHKSEKTTPPKPEDVLLKADPGEFKFQFDSDRQAQFAANPQFKLDSLEQVKDGDEEAWKAVARVRNAKGHELKLTEWFRPDRWLMTRFELLGEGDDGAAKLTGKATLTRFHCSDSDPHFTLDSAATAGFKETENADPSEEAPASLRLTRSRLNLVGPSLP